MILVLEKRLDSRLTAIVSLITESLFAFAGLLFIAFFVFYLTTFGLNFQEHAVITAVPTGFAGWTRLALSCLCTGYAEEGIFRKYLVGLFQRLGASLSASIGFSTALFGVLHLWEGAAGVINALISAIFLSFCYYRQKSLHSVSLAHGLYNFVVYALAAFKFDFGA
ncbi:MAG: CPBP family intramembrane metalloprotease [Spirochaetaceae bacterium]|nr:CPBP family intramembrane metalloprotease [Spirochaetaceae bacterium]